MSKARVHFSAGAGYAFAAAALFGASTPAAKLLIGQVPPLLLAGLLYAGSGIGLGLWWLIRKRTEPRLQRADLPALAGAGVWLHLTERHEHAHVHEELEHEHRHSHDEHHQHSHAPTDPSGELHSHRHHHGQWCHAHPHYPDLHHQHRH